MSKYLIWDEPSREKQFIFQDLLSVEALAGHKVIYASDELSYSDLSSWRKLDNIDDVVGNNICVFSSNNNKYHEILDVVKLLKPVITIHLSDEWGDKEEFQELHKHTRLLLRQYYHRNYCLKPNIKYIPLGYMNGMLETNYLDMPLKLPVDRKFKWSFIGTMKQNREEMLIKMESITPNCVGKLNAIGMREVYRDSIFVPNGRGNVKLDCLRLYEASLCGAIPIVVGSRKEIEETFSQEEDPPWLMFESWDEAYRECLELLENMESLNELSQRNVAWWSNRLSKLRDLISATFSVAAKEASQSLRKGKRTGKGKGKGKRTGKGKGKGKRNGKDKSNASVKGTSRDKR